MDTNEVIEALKTGAMLAEKTRQPNPRTRIHGISSAISRVRRFSHSDIGLAKIVCSLVYARRFPSFLDRFVPG